MADKLIFCGSQFVQTKKNHPAFTGWLSVVSVVFLGLIGCKPFRRGC
jgi:hypothetical protein